MSRKRTEYLNLVHEICEQFEDLLKHDKPVNISDWLQLVDKSDQGELFFELLRLETYHNLASASSNSIGDYFRKYPDFSNEIVKVFASNREAELEDEHASASRHQVQTITAGQRVGKYQIVSPLGAGGFSSVFLAHDATANLPVAMKFLKNGESGDINRNVECIINEANVLSKIEHPAIPKVYDAGKDEDGNPWVAMEFIKGESLYQKLATDRLSLVEVLRLLVKISMAVHEIHKCGFAHRDIKPDNIIIGLDGEPRILDYGLALHENSQKDKSGERAGTTAFMSPEQVRGQSENLDGRTDIWSLGVILYLVVAKRLPFQGETKKDIRTDILGKPVRPPRQIRDNVATVELEAICFRALKKDPEARYPTALDFAEALRNAIAVLPERILLEEAAKSHELTDSEQCSIQLARQANIWAAQPESDKLPGLLRYWRFRSRTAGRLWSESESKMMKAATRRLIRLGALLSIMVLVLISSQLVFSNYRKDLAMQEMIAVIKQTPLNEIDATYEQLSAFAPQEAFATIEDEFEIAAASRNFTEDKVRFAMILSAEKPELRKQLTDRLLVAMPDEIEALRIHTLDKNVDFSRLDGLFQQRLTESIVTTPTISGVEELWSDAPQSFHDAVRESGGQVGSRFAFCSAMPIEQFKDLSAEMRSYRYRPTCIRPWIDESGEQFIAAVWHRDTADWKVSWNLDINRFNTLRSRESMHLVDVNDGLKKVDGELRLVAIWSNYKDPYAEARHRLLAEKVSAISSPEWTYHKDEKYGIISDDLDWKYLSYSPLLVDVRIDNHKQFFPLESRENQKIRIGEMISQACSPNAESSLIPQVASQLRAAEKLKQDASFKLEKIYRTEEPPVESGSDSWDDLLVRTRHYAHTNDPVRANYCMALLKRAMERAVIQKTRPYLNSQISKAIYHAIGLELVYCETGDITEFLKKAKYRIQKVKHSKQPGQYLGWAEFYHLSIVSNSILQSDPIRGPEFKELKSMTEHLIAESLRARPSLNRRYRTELGFRTALDLPRVSPYAHDRAHSLMTSSWTSHAANFESKFVSPASVKAHQLECEKMDDGYIPVSIVLGKRIDGGLDIGTVWHRQIQTTDVQRNEQKVANALCYALKFQKDLGVWKILATKEQSSLKQRLIDTLHLFRVDVSFVVEQFLNATTSQERVALLNVIRNYSNCKLGVTDIETVQDSLREINFEPDSETAELIRIIRFNLESGT